jgi:endoglucanase
MWKFLEAIGGETAWGNPLISQRLIDSVKAAGFKAVRIRWPGAGSPMNPLLPLSRNGWIGRRCRDLCFEPDMYAIINEHGTMAGFNQPMRTRNTSATGWRHVETDRHPFRDYGDKVLFAGTNEVMKEGDYGRRPKNIIPSKIVTTRFLSAPCGRPAAQLLPPSDRQGFNTNINYTVSYFTIPFDRLRTGDGRGTLLRSV